MNAFVSPWLSTADPRSLALRRVLVFWLAWPGLRWANPSVFSKFEGVSWQPVGIPALLGVPLLPPSALAVAGAAITITTGLALVGCGYRVVAPLAAVLKLYLAWISQSSGKINHGGLLFTFVLLVLAFSRAADAWSVDAWVRKRRGLPAPGPSAEYHWPVRFIAVLVVTMYGAAGLTKLHEVGFAWAFSDTLRNMLLSHHFTHHPPTPLGILLADYPGLCRVLAFMALSLELSSPLALFHRHLYRLILPSLALLQVMIYLTLGVLFKEMVVNFACLLPWELLIARIDAWRSERGPAPLPPISPSF